MKTTLKAIALLAGTCAGTFASRAEITAGWLPTEAGTYDFLDTANWAGGIVNGVFSADWASAGNQTIQFGQDWNGAIKVYGAVNHEIVLSGIGGVRKLNINDDLHFLASAMSGTAPKFIIANTLVLDLGGASRNVSVEKSGWMLQGTVTNGTLVVEGSGTLNLRDSNAKVLCNVALSGGGTYATAYTSGITSDVSLTRAANLTMDRSIVHFTSRFNVEDIVTGELRILGKEPSCSFLRLSVPSSGIYESLSVGSLAVDNGGLLVVRGSSKLGANAPGTADTASLTFTNTPSVVNGLIPRVVGTIEANDAASLVLDPYKATFAAYDGTKGLKPLRAEDYATDLSGGNLATANLMVAENGTLSINENTTVNSLLLDSSAYNSSTGVIGGDSTLTVASGMVMAKPWKDAGKGNPQINVALNFADRVGCLVNAGTINGTGYRVRLGKPIAGTSGLVLQHVASVTQDFKVNGLSSFAVEGTAGNSTYTGNTYVQCVLQLNGNAFLPNGSRRGNVYVNGALECSSSAAADVVINGLYGSGLVYGRGGSLSVGDNNADGDFTGRVSVDGNTTVLATLNKIGAGTQRLAGTVLLGTALNVNAGTVVLDGEVTQGAVNVAAGATICGSGGITNDLVFASGAKLAVTVTDDAAPFLTVAGTASGGPFIVDATVSGGKWRTPQCILKSDNPIIATYTRGANIGILEKRNNGTELWAKPKVQGMAIVLR